MANMTATQLLKAIVKSQNGIFGEAEMRTFEHSLTGLLLGSQNEVFQGLNTMKLSDEQPTKAILFNRVDIASGTAKAAAHTAAGFADTFEKDIAYVKRVQKFKVSYKQADNNQFGYQEILNHNIKNALINLYEDISAYNVAWLDTNRTQVGVDSLLLFDETTDDQFEVLAADKDNFFEYLKSSMRKNKYRPMYDMVGDQKNAAEYRRIGAQGSGNSTNLSYTIPGFNYVEEEQIANSALGLGYVWQSGMVGMTTWNEPMNRRGGGEPGDNEGMFTTFQDPIFGMLHDLHIQRSIADTSGAGGNVQDVVDEYELTTIFTTQAAFESTADATPIFKVAQQA
jgi:hypothetical protein